MNFQFDFRNMERFVAVALLLGLFTVLAMSATVMESEEPTVTFDEETGEINIEYNDKDDDTATDRIGYVDVIFNNTFSKESLEIRN